MDSIHHRWRHLYDTMNYLVAYQHIQN